MSAASVNGALRILEMGEHSLFKRALPERTAAVGAVALISRPAIHRYRPLRDDVHCLYYDVEPGGLVSAACTALKQPERLARIARAARRHALRHHTHQRLCEYVQSVAQVPSGVP